MAEGFTPIEIFCCYAHEDEAWLRKLEKHLSLLKRQGLLSLWHDRLIAPGTDWAKTIDKHLETASVILLLVSADFFASDYCYGIEMQRALEREAAGEARVIPILVRPADWTDVSFAHLQALPTDAKPIVSWRNKDTALADIVAGIRRVIVEELPQLTASAPRAALPKIWNIPYPRNPFFLGRESELLQIHQNLQNGQATALPQPQAISGLGGIGKTQLALEYAYQYHQDYTAVLWVRAESTEALISSYVALATLLRLPERKAKEQEVTVQAVKIWLQTHRNWLLILDNADELALLPAFLPPASAGHMLLTTRATAIGRLAHRLEIETLLPEQGALLLLRRAAFLVPDAELLHVAPQERELAVQLSQELGGLPLALDQAGAYLEETGTNLADYWHIYEQHRAELLQRRGGLVVDHPEPIATTWSLSFQKVEEKNPAAAELLRMLTFLSPDAIAEEILTAGASQLGPMLAPVAADPLLFNQAIEALRAYSLVQRNPARKTLSTHRLVQAVLQETLEEEERHTWRERAMLAVNAAFPHADHEAWSQCERLLSQALFATQSIEQDQVRGREPGRLLYETASYLQNRARYAEAEPLYQRALHIMEQQLGPEHPDMTWSLNGLANNFREQGKYGEVEPLYQRALRIMEQQLGPEHPQVAQSLIGLGNIYSEQGKYGEAEPFYQRALRIREQQLGPEHPQVAWPLNNLAVLSMLQGKLAEAEPLARRALRIREQVLGPEHPEVADSLNNLASLYSEQGKYGEAEPLLKRALAIYEQALGPEHPEVAWPLNNLANISREQGKYGEAEPLYQRALRIREQALGPAHPEVAGPLNNLATLYYLQGKYGEAEPPYQRALRIREQALGPAHPEVAGPLNGLANISHEQGKYEEAELLYQRALQIRERQLGPAHPDTAETIHDLARFWETQGNSEEARALYARALAVREQALGAHHPQTTKTRSRLIALLHTMGQHEEAAQLEDIQSEL
jgi:tetratricopeptide (TPR) repeat protein